MQTRMQEPWKIGAIRIWLFFFCASLGFWITGCEAKAPSTPILVIAHPVVQRQANTAGFIEISIETKSPTALRFFSDTWNSILIVGAEGNKFRVDGRKGPVTEREINEKSGIQFRIPFTLAHATDTHDSLIVSFERSGFQRIARGESADLFFVFYPEDVSMLSSEGYRSNPILLTFENDGRISFRTQTEAVFASLPGTERRAGEKGQAADIEVPPGKPSQ